MIVVLIAFTILYNILSAIGVIDSIAKSVDTLLYQKQDTAPGTTAPQVFHINGFWLLSRAFAVGLVMVVFWSLVKLLATFMYNLIADLVGGIEITLTERR
jgi:hypothetical protein